VDQSSGSVVVAVPLDGDWVGARWGRAERVAVAVVTDGVISHWTEHPVGWNAAHDVGTEGQHHARIVNFLRDQRVQVVAADHVGAGMMRMLASMGVVLITGAHGPAREAAVAAAAATGAEPQS
jgi:predicted Fe-Mo cluster-binding NifX family protein